MSRWTFVLIAVLLMAAFALTGSGIAETVIADLDWHVLAIGGEPSSSGTISLSSTLGQAIIGESSGGNLGVRAGFWYGGGFRYKTYLPVVLNNY